MEIIYNNNLNNAQEKSIVHYTCTHNIQKMFHNYFFTIN